MKNSDKTKKHTRKRGRLILYGYAVVLLLVLATVSTYAWFSLSATPRVSNLNIYVNSSPGLVISVDPQRDGWTEQLAYDDLFKENYMLKPATWSEKDQIFYGAHYTVDGKLKNQWEPLAEDRHANNTSRENYYCVGTFYARAGSDLQVSLAPALAIEEGLAASGTYLMGAPVWNENEILHDNQGKGAENAIRIGIKVVRLNENLIPTDAPADFFIYEPNANAHIDGSTEYVDTPSINGSNSLIAKERIISQNTSTWSETSPVQRDVLSYQMGSFNSSSILFDIKSGEVVQMQVIIWLEGQDVDCTNAIADAHVIANLQFAVESQGGSGLVPIPKDPSN